MKKFKDALKDIEKLAGLQLQSIRPGAEIMIEEIDWTSERISLKTSQGRLRSRPFSEMEQLWAALHKKTAIHVDSELAGSGSSRNQPETILAHLPYIEWFMYSRKKHLAFMHMPSHALGTLKRMDDIAAEEMRRKLLAAETAMRGAGIARIIVVSSDLANHANMLEQMTGSKGQALQQGAYEFVLPSSRLLLVTENAVAGSIPKGTYLVIEGSPPLQGTKNVEIAGQKYKLMATMGLCLLYMGRG